MTDPLSSHAGAPDMAPWNLALRFGVELMSLVGLGVGGWALGSSAAGAVGGVIGLAAPVLGAVAWGTFNVEGDPSRSGRAPVPVSGIVRLAIESTVFLGGATGWLVAGHPTLAVAVLVAAIVTTVAARERVRWLLGR